METEFIAWLRSRLPASQQSGVVVGIGDDAAVLDLPPGPGTLVTVDMLTDGVDFRLADVDPRRVGRKALAVNLSDIAAMAGRPIAAFVAVALPRDGAATLARQLFEGLAPLAERYGVALAGGDTNTWDGPLVISITLLGQASSRGPLTRRDARPGDAILVTGSLGGSILGHHFDFEPRIDEALLLHERYELHAGIDTSDGLSLDLSRLCTESRVGAELELTAVPVSAAARELATTDGRSPLDHALADGEDFELILAVEPTSAERIIAEQPLAVPVTRIGRIVERPGLWSIDAAGSRTLLTPRGWQH
ncbi:MAG TPA: thiamine-phosphate kinase [Pirellulales bacterium]|jgi:thiamine-monophosphate kinase|nr:thiamine-phosphate kinase [Pirellulales bacterium]